MVFRARLVSSVVLVALLFTACPPGSSSGPTLTITGLETRRITAVVDQPIVLEVQYLLEDGTPTEPLEVVELGTLQIPVSAPNRAPLTSTFTTLGPGRRRYELTPQLYAQAYYGQRARTCADCPFTDTGLTVVIEPHPATSTLVPLDGPQLSLAVGEARHVSALSFGTVKSTANAPQVWGTHAAVTLTSADPAIARVEADTVVGVAPGTTIVTLANGAVTTTTTVTVVQAALGPPPDGRRPLFFLRMDGNEGGDRWRQPHPISQLVIDGRGAPVAVGTPYGNITGLSVNERPALLSQWTGTGFETRTIGRPGEEVVSPHLAIDARDVRYVLYRNLAEHRWVGLSQEHLTLATLAPGDAAFALQTLPLGDSPDALSPPDTILDRTSSTSTLAITARQGGGVWVAYLFLRSHSADDGDTCEARLRLAEVPPGAPMKVQDVARFSRAFFRECKATDLFERKEEDARTVVFDVTRRPGETPDLVLEVGRDEERPWSGRYALAGTTWLRSDYLTAADLRMQNLPFGPFALFPPRPSVDGSVPLWSHWGPPPNLATFVDPWPEPVVGRGEPFVVQLGDVTWLGNQHMLLMRRDPFHGQVFDDPTPRWFDGSNDGRTFQTERLQWRVEGADARAGRLHMAITRNLQMEHVVVTPPRLAKETSPEREGRAIELGTIAPRVRVAPSGVRWHFANRTGQGVRLGRSPMADAPWQFATMPERDVDLLPAIAEHDGKVWAFTQPFTGVGLKVLVSTDGGATFTVSRTVTTLNRVKELVVRGGLVFALALPTSGGQGELLRLDLSNSTAAPVDLATTLLPTRLPDGVHLNDAGDGVAVLLKTATRTWRIVRWSDAGALVENATFQHELGPIPDELDDRKVLIEAGGVVTGLAASGRPELRRRDSGSATFRLIGSLGDDAFGSSSAPLRAGTGKLVVPLTVRTLRDCWQLALRLSDDDGVTWRTGPVQRSAGGCAQSVTDATVQSGVLTVQVGDNESFRGFQVADAVTSGSARQRQLLQRIALP